MNRIVARSVLLLVFSTMVAVQFIDVSMANFSPSPYRGTPDYNKPTITVQEPYAGRTYNEKVIFYNITIVNPTSWYTEWGEQFYGGLTSVGYTIDGKENVTIAPIENQNVSRIIYDPTGKFFVLNPDYVDLPTSQTATLKGNLTDLPEGNHTVQFWANAISKYTPEEERNTFLYPVYEVQTQAASDTVSFYVTNQEVGSKTEPFPWLPVAAISVAAAVVVVVVAVVYVKKRRLHLNA